MICPNCGTENREDYKFCGNCGTPRPVETPVPATVVVPETPTIAKGVATPVPPPMPEVSALHAPIAAEKPRRKKRGWLTCLIIFLILLCLAAAALVGIALLKPEWLPFEIPFDIPFLAQNNNLIIGYPEGDGDTDLYLLRIGQEPDKGVLLASGAVEANSVMFSLRQDEMTPLSSYPYSFGAFVPEQDYLLYWYSGDDGEVTLNRMALTDKTPVTLLEEDAELLLGYVLQDPQNLFVRVAEGLENRCYLSQAGAAADEVLQGTSCYITADFSTAIAETSDGAGTSADLINLTDTSEFNPLSEQENVGEISLSGDGARLAYTDLVEAPNVILLNSPDGSTLVEGPDAYAVVSHQFASRGHIGYYISENNDGNLDLYLLSDSGASLVHSALSIGAELSQNGSRLVYIAGEIDGEYTLYVHDASGGSDVEVISGSQLGFGLANPLDQIFITTIEDGELLVYSANIDGSGLVNLYTGPDTQLQNIYYVPGQPYIFLQLTSAEGVTLLATRPDQADEYLVAENWGSVLPLDTSGDGLQLLFSGAQDAGDDTGLYLAQLDAGDNLTLDDDADGIGNALFSADGKTVLYTALTGSGPDDAEVRRINSDASEPAEVLYSEAILVAAQWDTLQPLLVTSFNRLEQSTSYCPGAPTLALGTALEANLEAGVRDCYRYDGLADEVVTFWIEGVGGLDTSITLYDRQGNYLDSDDYGLNRTDPRLITTLPTDGIYYLEVSSFGENAGSYSLNGSAGMNYCPGVEQLALGGELTGEMDDNGQVFYGFTGNANDSYTFWVESTDLDPMLSLYDSQGNMVNSDDNSRDGVDPLLIATLPEDGSYCLEVNTFGFETGPFTIAMVDEAVFCPGADTIELNQTVSGTVHNRRQVCYTFSATTDITYSFAVNSSRGTDTVLELYDETGNLIASDDDSGGNLNPLLTFNPAQAGTYYIVIRGYGSGSAGDYELTFSEGPGFCTNALPIRLGDTVNGSVEVNQEVCYVFDGTTGQAVLFIVDAEIDTLLHLYDETGAELAYDDDSGEGLNPRLRTTIPANGLYYIAISGYSSNAGPFTLSFQAAPEAEDPFQNPVLLSNNVRVSGAITEADNIYLGSIDFETYGHTYYFDGTAGQNIQIDAFADSLGSDLDPLLLLFNSAGEFLTSDDDSGSGYDSQLVYTLSTTGRYFVVISDVFSDYGTGNSAFYELLLNIR